jgi:hypothetical protein
LLILKGPEQAGIQEVRGSIPISSTNRIKGLQPSNIFNFLGGGLCLPIACIFIGVPKLENPMKSAWTEFSAGHGPDTGPFRNPHWNTSIDYSTIGN